MRGLIEKDLRLTLVRKQTLLIFLVMALFMSVSMDGSFIIGYLTMLSTIIAIGTISYDEYDNGFPFLMTLPFARKTYVIEKYIFSFLIAAAAWCVGTILFFIVNVIRHNTMNPAEELPVLIAILPALYLAAAFMIPLQLKYGAEKSRIILFILFGLIAVAITGSKTFMTGSKNPLAGLAKLLDSLSPWAVLSAIVAICFLISLICCLWSIKIVENKEY